MPGPYQRDHPREAASKTELRITAAERDEPLPLSFAQQRLWFLAQMEGVSQAYHIPLGLRLSGELAGGALRRALDRLVARHEALRTTFTHTGGQPVQRIAFAEESCFHLIEHDLRRRSDAEAELQRLALEEASAAFDLEAGPLIRGRLLRLAEDEHALLITMHHIVSDGWSMGVLTRELSALYAAFRNGQPDPLPKLAIQYPDYAVWQRRWLDGEVLEAQSDYWRRALAGAPAFLELPTDRRRTELPDHAGAFVPLELDEKCAAGLKALSRRHGATLFVTLLAGWAALLARLSGQDDVVIGAPVANRGHVEVEPLIGFFVNTLALRVDLSAGLTVGELLRRVGAQVLEALQHRALPFEQVVEIVRPPRSLAHAPVFQVMFAWHNDGASDLTLPGLTVAPLETGYSFAKCDLTLNLAEAGGGIAGGLEYATALFDRATVERYLGYFRNLLDAMVADDTQALDRVPLLGEAERRQLLHAWNATSADYPQDKCVHELFEAQAARTPGATAVVFEDKALSYAELNARANQLAHYLRELGVRPDDRVAICVERGFNMIEAVFAVLKAGGAYLPLDAGYPAERLRFMIEDSAPRVLLTQKHLEEMFAASGNTLPMIELDASAAAWRELPQTNLDPAAIGLNSSHLAYAIYTSGSTGEPKGVMIEHRGVCNMALAQIEAFKLRPDSRVLQFASFSFDAWLSELLMALCRGAALCVPPADILANSGLLQILRSHKITHVTLPPAVLQTLPFDEEIDQLQTLVMAGEATTQRLVQSWSRRCRLINAYGPTEATVCATMHLCDAAPISIPIGRPISNARIYILDAHGQPVPVGVAGEIYIGGAGVARGYLNRPELTAERFLPSPFVEGDRLYKTGDRGRYLPHGNIEFLGRNDFQVKVRGFRMELGEIEARLTQHPAVREAVVVVREEGGDKRLVAYYTCREEREAGAAALRLHLLKTLPEYMVPAAYVRLHALPITANGKLDRKALPSPEDDAFAARGYEPPQGEVEEKLAAIWAEALNLKRVGRHDNFFELGGHSLLAMPLISKIASTFGVQIGIAALFAAPTLQEFAVRVSRIEIPPEPWNIVQVQPLGEKTPIIAINSPMFYQKLSQRIGKDRPFLGVQLFDPGNPQILPSRSLEEIAADYVGLIRAAQPHGPYVLLGLCAAGLVAYEAARQLRQAGESVPLVVMADTWCSSDSVRLPISQSILLPLIQLSLKLAYHRSRWALVRKGRMRIEEFIGGTGLAKRNKLLNLLFALHLIGNPSKAISAYLESTWYLPILQSARANYQPGPFDGDVLLLQSRATPAVDFIDRKMGWSDLVKGRLLHFRLPEFHHLIFQNEGAVTLIAEHLRPLLNQVDLKVDSTARTAS